MREEHRRQGVKLRGYVLAGGGSTRFGRDKSLADIGGRSMLLRIYELLGKVADDVTAVVPAGKPVGLAINTVSDRWPGEGPLGGVITALQASAEANRSPEWNLIVGCDMPFLTREWLSYFAKRASVSDAEVIVPRSRSGLEPLCACWRTSAAGKLQQGFEGGVRKVTEGMTCLNMEIVDESGWTRFDSAGRLFWNMNTPAEYEEARRILESERS